MCFRKLKPLAGGLWLNRKLEHLVVVQGAIFVFVGASLVLALAFTAGNAVQIVAVQNVAVQNVADATRASTRLAPTNTKLAPCATTEHSKAKSLHQAACGSTGS